ncbi:MAG: 5'/3'-nucleotidase SurE [Saprospiraceae bacterium]|nr:5'/3'-nucleotidase SurE [Saprospiraceae bacterium]
MSKLNILVTNDDGMVAPGLAALVEVASDFGEVLVVAPNSPQSGQGHAITIENPLRLNKVNVFKDIPAYECNGTPADCVKMAKHLLRKNQQIDLCLSGINHGSNASVNIIYSGTMSAAMEAAIEGINSIGFSLLDYNFNADFSTAKHVVRSLLEKITTHGFHKECNLLNVNIPRVNIDEFKGFKICRQANGYWKEEFLTSKDPRNQEYYWLTGEFVNRDTGTDTDLYALTNHYASIVPSHYDLTHYPSLDFYKILE